MVIVTDDQRWDTLRYMPWVRRHLIHHGTTFENAFVVNPVCCPSRASILTGLYSHGTGVYTNRPPLGGVDAFDPSDTIATRLQDAGYRTALFGKYLNHYEGPKAPPGWDRWASFNGRAANAPYFDYTMAVDGRIRRYGHARKDYSTDVLADRAERFIEGSEAPFFLYLAPSAPHKPAIAGTARPSLAHVGSTSAPAELRGSRYLGQAGLGTGDPGHRCEPGGPIRRVPPGTAGEPRSRRRCGAPRRPALRASGELHHTLIVFTSDNGIHLGEHRLRGQGGAVRGEHPRSHGRAVRRSPAAGTSR